MHTHPSERRGPSPVASTERSRWHWRTVATVVVATIVVGGCGAAGSEESEPSRTTSSPTTAAPAPSTTTGGDEGQDVPTVIDWRLEADEVPCEVSDLPGGPGGEAVVPATWAVGNADFVEFVVDDDLRPANMVREVAGPGNVQVPCDPRLNDGHTLVIVAATGSPGDRGREVVGEALVVTTTATLDGGL